MVIGKSGERQPVQKVAQEALPVRVKAVEQRGKCRTEQPIGQEIGGKVQQMAAPGR